ncbi:MULTISPECIES: septal ring lytic transglycosylase RlpA family protein [Vibrio]|jgi:rare lipoprotein A|uniref:Endolytic peptidoglycan transglycosylase RlpA n=4 Tax=Vibrio harveyi group TaxID=717610 RepID=A0A7Y0X092_VIBAL|nr:MULTISPECIES: septal ring lytic transglycosylase RlpA family protein [Vibrio]MDG2788356.1 septal ring lytic transglycosylase RlpA family protein [Vibrio parahaemolyticus]MDW1811567.1 septal ring lytic transglycosylase RlpA family protein [Vibrio sp. Vb2362]MDW1971686.1 septal ring lytic transglycosylase RlpA family protein [Vibrio sp. 945]MDW2295414.1 septal ring lytic transglycosylase RlpA family protein [Vibrio sp. 1404]NAW92540.1 septal ring lytic transglycosylase RlpA family protein [Vi
MQKRALYSLVFSALILAGCSSTSQKEQEGRYELESDVAPDTPLSVEHIEDAHPKYEPYSLGGNKDYHLRGKDYKIVRNAKGFKEKGRASWYGKKFQGHLTSNGEIYDMYSMTAAHKTLPLPSYVKVTNTDNGKTTIVRVNDRGPFHDGRIIDLSYAAAHKLDVIKTGTANVEIEVISINQPTDKKSLEAHPRYVIQVASSKNEERARTLGTELGQKLDTETFLESAKESYRLLLGPFTDYSLTQATLDKVKLLGYSSAFIKKHNTAK